MAACGRLEYLPEPTVAADGARHRTDIRVDLAAGAALVLRDEVILGRHGERGGACRTRLRADLAGVPLLRHELDVSGVDEVSLGPAVLAGQRTAGSLLCVDRTGLIRIGLNRIGMNLVGPNRIEPNLMEPNLMGPNLMGPGQIGWRGRPGRFRPATARASRSCR